MASSRKVLGELFFALLLIVMITALAVGFTDCVMRDACEEDGTVTEYDCSYVAHCKDCLPERICKWRCE